MADRMVLDQAIGIIFCPGATSKTSRSCQACFDSYYSSNDDGPVTFVGACIRAGIQAALPSGQAGRVRYAESCCMLKRMTTQS